MGTNQTSAEEEANHVEDVGGYVFIPADSEIDPAEYLAHGSAPLWFSSQAGKGGIGRSVQMTKDVEEKDKKPEPDVDRQKRFDLACAKLKHALGLSKENLINYHIGTHTIEIYDIEGNLKGEYDLTELGIDEDPENPIKGGGGLKQILRDHFVFLSDDQTKTLQEKLVELNKEMQQLIEPETGGKLSYEYGLFNKGNTKAGLPFLARFDETGKVLNPKNQQKPLERNMARLGFFAVNAHTGKVNKKTLSQNGAAAITDLKKVKILQRNLLENIRKKQLKLQNSLIGNEQKYYPYTALLPNTAETEDLEALRKELRSLEDLADEIRGSSPNISSSIRELERMKERLERKAVGDPKNFTSQEKKKLKEINQKIAAGNAKNQPFQESHNSTLTLMLLLLNKDIQMPHNYIQETDGALARGQTRAPTKLFLRQIPVESRPRFGVESTDARGADIARTNMVEHVANTVASDFEKITQLENSSRKLRNWFQSSPMGLDPNKESHQEIQRIGTNMGALVYDISSTLSSEPSRLRKIAFTESRKQEAPRESRALEFLIANVFQDGVAGLRGFSHEQKSVQEVLQTGLEAFKKDLEQEQAIAPNTSSHDAFVELSQLQGKLDEAVSDLNELKPNKKVS